MIKKISICGKGGSGKSVIITLLANAIRKKGYEVLVVDTDESNTGLYKMLDFEEAPETLSESFGGRKGITKYWNENRLADLLLDTMQRKSIFTKNGIGLLSIGKIVDAGGGCACPLNAVVREFLKIYESGETEILLVDTEAGVEHLGRGNEKYVDAIIIVVDPSYESLELAKRAMKLSMNLGIPDERIYIITNKVDDDTNKILMNGLKERGLESNFAGSVKLDAKIREANILGKPIIEYEGCAAQDIEKILNNIMAKK
ncbi:MAG: hypothetical protein A7316_09115 [Candidatus Altiarchaeales archaeon WOR_SM1_86-2]|nr:MAG: hypothetical protein A7316_09115 [Candidatus Altiarchaeales archaeon WOR_SM1_86-2]